MADVVQGYLTLAEKRTEAAKQESADLVADVDDLENLATPEMIMLSAVSGEDAKVHTVHIYWSMFVELKHRITL